jgi:putative ABC transport system permease protein
VFDELRYACRQIRHNLGFSAVVAATLALGIGGTTAVFSVTHAVVLAPLPYAEPGQLVRIYQQEPGSPSARAGVSAPHFRTLREQAASFTDVTARYLREDLGLDLSSPAGDGQRLRTLLVTSDYFRTLRAEPFIGPGFQLDDEAGAAGDDRVGARRVVLSNAVWRTRFSGDASIVGRTIRLSAEAYEVVGVAPAGFEDPVAGVVDAWLPYNLTRDTLTQNYSLTVLGRVRTGVSLDQAAAELAVMSQAMKERWPEVRASSLWARPLQEDVVASSRGLVQVLGIAVGLVLLVACVNVANLVLVRATARAHEFAVRAALGSSHSRLARQLLVESLVLAVFGGIAGLGLAALGVKVLRTLGQEALPRLGSVGFEPVVLAFAAVVTIATALICGVLPALRLVKSDPNRALTQQSRAATGSRRQQHVRNGLAAAQFALALALLAGAGVLSMSFYRLTTIDFGFRLTRVLTFDVNLPSVRYDAERRAEFHEDLARRLMEIPAVTAAGATSRLPATGSMNPWPLMIETGPLAGSRLAPSQQPEHRTVSGDFFKAMAIPVLAGRTFDERDDANAPMRAVVSANLARLAFPGLPLESVVGQRVAVLTRKNLREIIGVVGDVTLDVYGRPSAAVYSAHRQFASNRNWALTQVVAASEPPDRIIAPVRAVVASMDPELVVYRVSAIDDVVGRGSSRERFALVLMGVFAGVSLALAGLGLYGVLAYTVRQRTRELGIRIALGASESHVRALVLRQAAMVLSLGILAGAGGAWLLGRWLSSLLFRTSPWDPRVLIAVVVLLSIVGFVAAWLPARRASRLEARMAMDNG